jgi:acetoin utilization deacetylase AcuC-like enzyme
MPTRLYTHSACLEHDMGPGHPERPERLVAILQSLKDPELAALEWHEAPSATVEQIARAHPRAYVEAILGAVPNAGWSSTIS